MGILQKQHCFKCMHATSKDLSLALNGSLGSAKNLLNRLYKQQLVNRSTTSETFKKSYDLYSLSQGNSAFGIFREEGERKMTKEFDLNLHLFLAKIDRIISTLDEIKRANNLGKNKIIWRNYVLGLCGGPLTALYLPPLT